MARYMLTSPAFLHDGQYYEAGPLNPRIINLPDDAAPSLKWAPLDKSALAALEALRAQQIQKRVDAGATLRLAERDVPRVKPILGAAVSGIVTNLPVEPVSPVAKVDPDALDRAALDRVVQAQRPKGTPETTVQVPKGKRPSDQEPT